MTSVLPSSTSQNKTDDAINSNLTSSTISQSKKLDFCEILELLHGPEDQKKSACEKLKYFLPL